MGLSYPPSFPRRNTVMRAFARGRSPLEVGGDSKRPKTHAGPPPKLQKPPTHILPAGNRIRMSLVPQRRASAEATLG